MMNWDPERKSGDEIQIELLRLILEKLNSIDGWLRVIVWAIGVATILILAGRS